MQNQIVIDTNVSIPADSLLRLEQVMSITSLCRSHVFLLMKKGEFPASITVGVRGARWSNASVQRWIANKIASAATTSSPHWPQQ